jgi:hypothetical protein
MPLQRAPGHLDKWRVAETPEERFYAASDGAMAAYHLGEYDLAWDVAIEAIALAEAFKDNWNYGNALHYAHTVLGLLAARSGNIELASAELLASGTVRGSPQLNSFGPSMRLARELLKMQRTEPVLQYFQLCRTFWEMGGAWLEIWEKKVKRGAVPLFVMQSSK